MYSATIVDKAIVNGVLRVKVQFSNGEDTFNDTFETSQAQPDSWAEEQIQKRLAHLNKLPDVKEKITIGKKIDPKQGAPTDAEREAYQADLDSFRRMVNALTQGVITKDQPDFVALRKKLADNFKIEYLEFF